MENKIFAYMRISTNKKTQKVDRQQQTIIEYSVNNNFKIDKFVSDVIVKIKDLQSKRIRVVALEVPFLNG